MSTVNRCMRSCRDSHAYVTFGLQRANGDRKMPKFPFSRNLRTEIVRYYTVLGRHRVVVASTILFNSELYKKN